MSSLSERLVTRLGWRTSSRLERALLSLGVRAELVEDFLGDLAEEYASRIAAGRAVAARWWYVREVARGLPHLLRNAIRYAGPRERVRLAACGAAAAFALTLTLAMWMRRDLPVARLVTGHVADEIVINSMRPVRLAALPLDALGQPLDANAVRYEWQSGTRMKVSSQGVLTCAKRGDARVRASVGDVSTLLMVRCRPVRTIAASRRISLVAGGPMRYLPFTAWGADGSAVDELRGAVRVREGTIASIEHASIRPREVGETAIDVQVGDRPAQIRVLVHEPVPTFSDLRADQRLVATPVHLEPGETKSVALPPGAFWLTYVPRSDFGPTPSMRLRGAIGCARADARPITPGAGELGLYCVRYPGAAAVRLESTATGAGIDGWLALERVEQR